MTTNDRNPLLATDEQPTDSVGSTAVLAEAPTPGNTTPTDYSTYPAASSAPGCRALPASPPVVVSPATTFSLVSLLLGIISIFFGFLILAPTAGLVFGILGVRREPTGRTMAVWGIVLNSVMLGVAALLAALAFVGIVVPLLR